MSSVAPFAESDPPSSSPSPQPAINASPATRNRVSDRAATRGAPGARCASAGSTGGSPRRARREGGGLHRRHDRVPEALLRPLDRLAGRLGLLVRVGEDHRPVLIAHVGALAVQLRRVMDREVLRDQLLERHLARVELDLRHLGVPGGATADLLIRGVFDVPALVSDGGVEYAVQLAELVLHLPEAAGAERGLLGRVGSGIGLGHQVHSPRSMVPRVCLTDDGTVTPGARECPAAGA